MSKTFPILVKIFAISLLIVGSFHISAAQSLNVRVHIDIEHRSASISGQFVAKDRPNKQNLTFLDSYAGASAIAARVSSLELDDAEGKSVSYHRLQPGEYLAAAPVSSFRYNVDLRRSAKAVEIAHTSSLAADSGILFLTDLLPQVVGKGRPTTSISFDVPPGWQVISTNASDGKGTFMHCDLDRSVFYIARADVFRTVNNRSDAFDLRISGDWQFYDTDAVAAVREIFVEYAKLFSGLPGRVRPSITLFRMPSGTPAGVWEADTRGSSVTIVSSDAVFKSQSLQRLHEQLRHEIFHLWLPNGVDLTGNYDWFYEGFALYLSLKTGLALKRIRFEDYLNTLSNAMAYDRLDARRVSLIEASGNRFAADNNTTVYARGMLVGFLSDIEMLKTSKGRRSIDDIIGNVYRENKSSGRDGNEAVIAAMTAFPELSPIVENYVRGNLPIDISSALTGTGIVIGKGRSLAVNEKLSGREKAILDKLGYNNWRRSGRP